MMNMNKGKNVTHGKFYKFYFRRQYMATFFGGKGGVNFVKESTCKFPIVHGKKNCVLKNK